MAFNVHESHAHKLIVDGMRFYETESGKPCHRTDHDAKIRATQTNETRFIS